MANPSATLDGIRVWLMHIPQEALFISAIDICIRHQWGYRYKKTVNAREHHREDVVKDVNSGKTGKALVI